MMLPLSFANKLLTRKKHCSGKNWIRQLLQVDLQISVAYELKFAQRTKRFGRRCVACGRNSVFRFRFALYVMKTSNERWLHSVLQLVF